MNDLSIPGAIERLERYLLTLPQPDIQTIHTFLPGIYERKIIIPPWTVLTGAQHKTDYTVRLEAGTIAVNTDDGMTILRAPEEFKAKAGMKRVGRVFDSQVIWVDVYENTNELRNIDELDEMLYVVPEIGMGHKNLLMDRDRKDYKLFLEQLGTTDSALQEIVQIEDTIPMPNGFSVELRKSKLHGIGLFATKDFMDGEYICPGRLEGKRTPAGRYINHSVKPNARPIKIGDDIHAEAIKQIYMNEEILVDYRDSMRVNFGLMLEAPCLAG